MDERTPIFCDIIKEKDVGAILKEILVIDDEDYISDILRIVLSEIGYSVTSFQDGSVALKHILENDYRAIFCDLKMPGLDGIEIYERSVALRPYLKNRFVLLTGSVLDNPTKALIEKKGIKILFKPFNLEDVQRIIKELEESHDK